MKVTQIVICTHPLKMPANETDEETYYQVINKLWFTLEDDVYEQMTDETNQL